MTRSLEGKAAIVTGGARGVTKGVATAFIKAGARVLIVDREGEAGRDTESELKMLGGEVAFLHYDLSQRGGLSDIVDHAIATFGQLDTLVNGAQASQPGPLAETSIEAMSVAFDTGFWPTFLLMQAAFRHLVKTRGSVINFATGGAFQGLPTLGSYVAAKEAIRAISKVAATEWGPDGVRVNVMCPFADSPGVRMWAAQSPEAYAEQISKVPLQRIGDCEKDIGPAAVFLASDDARYITGHTLMVDGGNIKAV
jgi:NAD(P)-dependent dehydrogenase (short-subunit alcohol dehydrogenase family)